MAGELYRRVAEFRRDLLALERSAASEMVRAYGASWRRIEDRVLALWNEVQAMQAVGAEVPAARLFQLDRYLRLQAEVEAELRRFAAYAESSVAATQMQAVTMAQQHTPALFSAVASDAQTSGLLEYVDFHHVPVSAVEQLVSFSADGTPLGRLLNAIPNQVDSTIRETLTAGLTLGQNPRETARQVRRAYSVGMARALTISRTETLRAYREASRLDYQANDDLIEGWVWNAACDGRTCVACWAMHGRVFKLNKPMPNHPNCRCGMIPLLKRAYRGDYEPQTGTDLFARAAESVQRRVLGPQAFERYQAGELEIADFVRFRRSREWGITATRASLAQAQRQAARTP